ncbi:MAG TPA: metallophosphoesterase [Kineosporiaceae bacterium]|nr:metallophosphoesterase [Kineosporiaceae bacterium]
MRATILARGALAAVTVGAAGLGYAALEAQAFTLRRFTVPVLPPGSPRLTVLHVSDIHLLPRQHRKAAWVHALADLEPDLVISTGDNIAGPGAVPAALAAQAPLLARPGVFVLGSNDYFGPKPKNPARYLLRHGGRRRIKGLRLPTDDLVKGFLDAGWVDLGNARATLTVRGLRLDFVGVDDPHLKRDRYRTVAGPADPAAALTIGVAHAPYRRVLDAMTADGARLLLAGHTHGGQLCLPGYGTLVTNCDLPRRQARGLSRWAVPATQAPDGPGSSGAPTDRPGGSGDPADEAAGRGQSADETGGSGPPTGTRVPGGSREAWLHVSAGIGTSPYTPVRFACRPEASLLTLVPRTA